jgi:hypothetical protein
VVSSFVHDDPRSVAQNQMCLMVIGATPATDASWGPERSKLWRSHVPIACYARSKGYILRSILRLHALFRGRLDASLSSRCLEFVSLEEEDYRPGLPCPKMREASIDRRMALSRVRDRLHGSTVRMFDLVGRFASGREPKYGSSFTRY